ncbi:MAG: helix-turn-helix transcriptional regulator [Oceanobacter sp.]
MTLFKPHSSKEASYLAVWLLQSALGQLDIEVTEAKLSGREISPSKNLKDPTQFVDLNIAIKELRRRVKTKATLPEHQFSFAAESQALEPQPRVPLQLLFLSSETLGEALDCLEKFFPLLIDQTPLKITSSKNYPTQIHLNVYPMVDENHQRWITELLINNLLLWIRQLCLSQDLPIRLQLPWQSDDLKNHYEACWKAEVLMGRNECLIELAPGSLDLGDFRTHEVIRGVLLNEVENQFRRLIRNASLADSLTQAFSSGALHLNAEQTEVAQLYNISARTLNRYLKKENTSLKQISTRSRIAIAKNLLVDTNDSIQDIAVRVKLSGRRALDRLFISAEGVSPARYRELNKKAPVKPGPVNEHAG